MPEVKDFLVKGVLPGLLKFLSDIVKALVEGTIPPEELQKNPELLAFIYAGLQYADKRLGENEEEVPEVVVDELKEAIKQLAQTNNVPPIEMFWD